MKMPLWINRNFLDYSLIHLELEVFEFPDYIPHENFVIKSLEDENYKNAIKIRLLKWVKQCDSQSIEEILSPAVIQTLKQYYGMDSPIDDENLKSLKIEEWQYIRKNVILLLTKILTFEKKS
jgi:hypothetical protein